MRSTFRLWNLVAIAGAVLVTSGCSALPFSTNDSKAAIDVASQTPLPAGYTIASISGGQNSFDYQNPEYTLTLVKKNLSPAPSKECAAVIEFAQSLGATHWFGDYMFPPDVMFPIESHPAQAQINCVNVVGDAWDSAGVVNPDVATAMFSMWGENTTLLSGKVVPLIFEFNVGEGRIHFSVSTLISAMTDSEGAYDSFRAWTWDEALSAVDSGFLFRLTALDPIGQFRSENPNAPLDSLKSIRQAYNQATTDTSLGKVDAVKDKRTGKVYLHVNFYSNYYDVCVSIPAFDPEYFGVDDPGFGYGIGSSNEWQIKDEFGVGTRGECPPAITIADEGSAP